MTAATGQQRVDDQLRAQAQRVRGRRYRADKADKADKAEKVHNGARAKEIKAGRLKPKSLPPDNGTKFHGFKELEQKRGMHAAQAFDGQKLAVPE